MCGNPRITCSRSVFHPPFEITHSLSHSAVVRQKREQTHCRVGFARTFVGHSRTCPRVSGARRAHLPGHPETEKVRFKMSQSFTPHSSESL
jgi:hypothetical protein